MNSVEARVGRLLTGRAFKYDRLIKILRRGLPVTSVERVMKGLGVASAESLLPIIGMSNRTYARRKQSNQDLTPLGGERAGNTDGFIPAWSGGYTTPIPGEQPGGRRGDPFKEEKPLFSISAGNAAEYADKLTDGTLALLKKYPESFRVDVYPSHRTAAAPQWVYDNTFKNATRAKLNGDLVEGAYGGIPFPLAKNGAEVMWNHILRWRGSSWQLRITQYQLTTSGRAVMTTDGTADQQMPYYLPDSSPEAFAKTNEYWNIRLINQGPPIRAGEAITGREQIDGGREHPLRQEESKCGDFHVVHHCRSDTRSL
jgi:hypothetical protein